MKNAFGWGALLAACVSVAACGGGGGGPVTPSLSAAQKLFEETALTANGGTFAVNPGWSISAPGSIPGSTQTFTFTTQATGLTASYFELAKSPLGEANGVVSTYYPAVDLISALPTLANRNEALDTTGSAFIENGQIKFIAAKKPSLYSYSGSDILVEASTKAGDASTKFRTTGYTKVALTGKVADAPAELQQFFHPIASYVNASATFLPGAAYYKRTSVRVGDHLFVSDADFNPTTDPESATGAYTGTIEGFAGSSPTTLDLAKGTIKTVKGARCWVNNTAGSSSGPGGGTTTYAVVPSFDALCEAAGKVYRATLQPDGASLGTIYPNTGAPTTSPIVTRANYQLRYNEAAAESIANAVN